MSSKIFLFTTLLLFFVLHGVAQPVEQQAREYSFKMVGIKEGLSQSTVLSIYQDHYGFIWLGTRNGLNRYDGHSMTTFLNKIGDKTSLAGNIINKIQEDGNHNVWVATNKGLSVFDRKREIFTNYSIRGAEKPEVLDLEIDKAGFIWIGCAGGLFTFEPSSSTFTPAAKRFEAFREINSQYISSLHIQRGSLFIGTNVNGVYIVNLKSKKIRHIAYSEFEKSGQSPARVNDVIEDNRHAIWVGTKGNGLYRFNADGSVNHFSQSAPSEAFQITNDNVRALTIDKTGNVWVGTFDGLNVIWPGGQIDRITYQDKKPEGLSHGSIRALFTDRNGSVWIGTYFGGVNIYDRQNQQFNHYYHVSGDNKSLSFNVIGAFTEAAPGRLIIGTERGGINLFNPYSGKVIPAGMGPQNNLTIKSLYTSHQGAVWAGVFKEGLQQVNPQTGQLTPVRIAGKNPLSNVIINAITEDKQGNLWLATDDLGGIQVFNPREMRYQAFLNDKALHTLLAATPVRHLLLDKNRLWIATRGKGLLSYDLATGVIKTYKQVEKISVNINSVFCDKDGNLWLATNGDGIIRFNPATNAVSHIHAVHGLLNNITYGIIQDGNDDLWISTLTGLSRYIIRSKKFKNYSASSGFPLLELNEGLIYQASNGDFFVGGNNGFVSFNPLQITENEQPAPVIITRLNLLGQHTKSISALGSNDTNELHVELTHRQPVFTIEYASLNYLRPENEQYAYRLLGLDDTWYPLKDRRNITFSNLPAGRYTFQVRASSDGVNWYTAKKAVDIRILPAPWLSWWAIGLYIIAAIAIIFAIRHSEIRKNKLAHNLRIEQLEKNRWKEVHDIKLKYFTDVSHEFRTPLTLITNPVEDLVNDENNPPETREKLGLIYQNSKRLLLLIDQILDINRLDAGRLALNLSSVSISTLLQNIVHNFKSLADKQHITLNFIPGDETGYFMADVDKLEKIFYNLLSNAFKFTPSGGIISLSYITTTIADKKTGFCFDVTDTGKGFSPEERERIFERFYKVNKEDAGAGVGLSLTRSLIELMGGTIEANSTPGKGSTFKINLSFEKNISSTATPENFLKTLLSGYEQEVHNEPALPAGNPAGGKEIILIAEDNVEINNYLYKELNAAGFKVITATNGAKAWEKVQKVIPDIVITDVLMPEMDGLELCSKLKNDVLTSHIPVIMLTAKTDDYSRINGLETGADDYLAKPFLTRELKIRIHNLLQNRKRLQEKLRQGNPAALTGISVNRHDQQLLEKITHIIDKNISQPNLSVEFIGDKIGMSREHLFRKLKAITGLSPSDFIRDYRLNKAAALLIEKQLKVAEAAFEVGYQDVQYFSKCFKKKFNCSPQHYYRHVVSASGN
ncbi:response regulator (plasmid) [Pedobacter sp. BS3]|uniref:hybrid sensor histidine kinase/response regulator transcription factor n=1 Tax=Pedobacter sp. BS3 TaxID=2567937 RepID=UPI0011ED017F|nr:hybrid sensor histidine kinase/response regulator transcription factor [Pedobacter sp. BS3]TZF85578.1 response regulator [Pedobacter sp. BS3]